MNRKGFTLLELIAVITILAIIMLITIPVVTNIIDEIELSAAEKSAELYVDTVNKTIASKNMLGNKMEGKYLINSEGNLCPETSGVYCREPIIIETDGNKPKGGYFEINKLKVVKTTSKIVFKKYTVKYETEKEAYVATKIGSEDGEDIVIPWPQPMQKPNIGSNNTIAEKTWNGYNAIYGSRVWTDGVNVYHSIDNKQHVLKGDTWEEKTWKGLTSFRGESIWSDGTNIYYSSGSAQYVLKGDTWEEKTWKGFTNIIAAHVWTDGTNIYYSKGDDQYVLNGDTWEPKTWVNKPDVLEGNKIWTDGTNIYYSYYTSREYVLKGNTWEPKTWKGFTDIWGAYVWTDGTNIYYSNGDDQYVLNGDTWEPKTWKGYTRINGSDIWTDGINTYFSNHHVPFQGVFSQS